MMMNEYFITDSEVPYKIHEYIKNIKTTTTKQTNKKNKKQYNIHQHTYKHLFQCSHRPDVYLVSLCLMLVSAVIKLFFDSRSRHINLYIKFLNTAWKVGTLLLTNKVLALVHLGSLRRILNDDDHT